MWKMPSVRNLFLLTLLFSSALFVLSGQIGPADAAVTKKALVVGISDYQTISDLKYPHKDAKDMTLLLQAFLWKDITTLINSSATKDAIEKELGNIAKAAPEYALFYFSGHGDQDTDQNPLDEADNNDEYLSPYDSTAGTTEGDISDDYLKTWVDSLPSNTNVAIILDSCNSGGFTETIDDRDYSVILTAAGGLLNPPKDDQSSYGSSFHGRSKFTYHLYLSLMKTYGKLEPAFASADADMQACNCILLGSPQKPLLHDHYLTRADPRKDYDLMSTLPCLVGGVSVSAHTYVLSSWTFGIASITLVTVSIAKLRKRHQQRTSLR